MKAKKNWKQLIYIFAAGEREIQESAQSRNNDEIFKHVTSYSTVSKFVDTVLRFQSQCNSSSSSRLEMLDVASSFLSPFLILNKLALFSSQIILDSANI